MQNTFDLIIIGGGPAGCAAAVYAARKRMKTLLIAAEFGGQSIVSEKIYNWIGTPEISGPDLAHNLEAHVREYIKDGETLSLEKGIYAEKVEKTTDGYIVTASGKSFETKTLLVTTGSSRKKLEVVGAAQFENKGIVYCASCDGPLFSGQDVAVIGAGNSGFESAAQLLAYTNSVTLFSRTDHFRADQTTVDKVLAHPNMRVITNAKPIEIEGDKFVSGIKYEDTKTGEVKTLPVTGIFVEIGQIPNTGYVADVVKLTEFGTVVTDPTNQQTSATGIWAAGDCTDGIYHQNNIAAGDAVKAIEDIYQYIHAR